MPTSIPTADDLRGFLLGTLSPSDSERIAAWATEHSEAGEVLREQSAHDLLTAVLSTTLRSEEPPSPAVEEVIRTVMQALGAERPDTATSPTLERIGGYRVVRELGRGGMGVVYEAIDEQLHRRVALKVMKAGIAASDPSRQRFLREGRSAATVKSDHVVTIYQVGEAGGIAFLAMEYLEGANLEDWLKALQGPIGVEELLWAAKDVLAGLSAVHSKGLIHRDIKPANLWVEPETGRVKVLDFGLTRNEAVSDAVTKEGAVLGTPSYMAPEQADGKPVDARADLFSVGVVLYRMAAGRSPFQRDTMLATLTALASETPPPVAAIPTMLSGFVARLMAKDRDDRPADAKAALAELREIELHLKAQLAAPPRKPRRKWLIAASILGALTATVLLAQFVIIRDKEGKEVARIKVPEGGTVERTDEKGNLEPEKKPSPPAINSQRDPQTQTLDALNAKAIPAAERFVWQPKELVAVIGTHARRMWGPTQSVDVSPDGKLAAVAMREPSTIVIWDVATQKPRWVIPDSREDGATLINTVRFTPDGQQLIVAKHTNGVIIEKYDLTGSEPRYTGFGTAKPSGPIWGAGNKAEILEGGKTIVGLMHGDDPVFMDVSGEKPIQVGERLNIRRNDVVFASSADRIVYVTSDGKVRIATVRNARAVEDKVLPIEGIEEEAKRTNVYPWLSISADGRRLAIWINKTNELQIWDIDPQASKLRFQLTNKWHYNISQESNFKISPNGRWLTSGTSDITLFKIDDVEPVAICSLGKCFWGNGMSIGYSSKENIVVNANQDGIVRFWDLSGEKPKEMSPFDIGTWFGGPRFNNNPLHLRDSKILLKQFDRNYQLWDLSGSQPRPSTNVGATLSGWDDDVLPVFGGGWLKTCYSSVKKRNSLFRFREGNWEQIGPAFGELHGWGDSVSRDGKRLVAIRYLEDGGSGRFLMEGWDLSARPPSLEWELPIPKWADGPWTTDGQLFATLDWRDKEGGAVDLKLLRWKGPKPEEWRTITLGCEKQWYRIALSPDGRYLAHTKNTGNEVVLTDLSGVQPKDIMTLKPERHVHSLAFSSDGRLAWGGQDGAGIWDIANGKSVWSWMTAPGKVMVVQFADDGRHLITLNANHTVYVLRITPK